MSYFKKIKKGTEVFGLVFGKGVVSNIIPDSYYSIFVEFNNGSEVAYTEEGIPNWGNFNEQTLFFKDDVCLEDVDFYPIDKILSKKKIIKLRELELLEIRFPSGIWGNVNLVDEYYLRNILEKEKYHFFRKKK